MFGILLALLVGVSGRGDRDYDDDEGMEYEGMGCAFLMLCEIANGILTLLIGVTGLKGISSRSPQKAKKMFKRGVCLVLSILVISLVIMVARFAAWEGHDDREGKSWDDVEGGWGFSDDTVIVEDDNIVYVQGDALQIVGHIEYEQNGAVVNIDMSWESEEAQNIDWSSFFYDLFEMGNDFAQALPQNSTMTITIVDNNGAVYTISGEKDWYEPPVEYSPRERDEEHEKHEHDDEHEEEDEE